VNSPKTYPILKRTLAVLCLAVAAGVLMFAIACGDDDSDDESPSPTGSGEGPSATGPTPTDGDGATPAGTHGGPAICAMENTPEGTITTLDFDKPTGGPYEQGEGVEITLTIANCGDNDIVLNFDTTQRYLFIAEDKDGNEVWKSADGQTYDEEEGQETIPPNETVIYEETWDQQDSGGEQVPDGVYKISAFSIGCTADQTDCRFGPVRQVQIGEGEES